MILSQFKIEKFNGLVADIGVENAKYLIVCTQKGHIGIYDLLADKKVGFVLNDYQSEQTED